MFELLREQMLAGSKVDQAIKDNDSKKLEELIEANPEQNLVDGEIGGVPKIIYAAHNKFWDVVKVLFNSNANIDVQIEYRNRYFAHECVENAPEGIVKAVLDYANLNNKNSNGENCLLIAIKKGRKEVIDYILESGRVDLSSSDNNGNNAAHLAAKKGDYDLFLKLAELKCPLVKLNKDDNTPVDLIEDVSFKDNLTKILGEINKVEKNKATNVEVKEAEENKPVISGLSKIKRK